MVSFINYYENFEKSFSESICIFKKVYSLLDYNTNFCIIKFWSFVLILILTSALSAFACSQS